MKKKTLEKIAIALLFSTLIFSFSFAQHDEWQGWVQGEEASVVALPRITFATAVSRFANLLFYFTAFLALIFIIYAAIIMVTASGDPGKIETARAIIMYAVIALAIAVIAYGLVSLLLNYLTGGRAGGGTPGTPGGGIAPPPGAPVAPPPPTI
jgi:hypothetical protein